MSPRPQRVSRLDVLIAARDLVDESGLEQLTMRRLGAALGADPMTAYRHFAGKAELAAALADEFWAGLALPHQADSADWAEYAHQLMRAIRSALAEHSGLIPIVATHPISSPAGLAVADQAIGALLTLGAPADPSLGDLVNVLVMVTVASAMGEYSAPAGTEPSPTSASEQPTVEAETPAMPHLGRIFAAGWIPDAERQFEAGITAILRGWVFPSRPA